MEDYLQEVNFMKFWFYVPIRNISHAYFGIHYPYVQLETMPCIGWESVILIGIHFSSNVNHFRWHILAVSLENCCWLAEKEASTLDYQIFRLSFTVFTLTTPPGTIHVTSLVPTNRLVTEQGEAWPRNKISRRTESQSSPWRKRCWATYFFLGQREAFSSIQDSELRTLIWCLNKARPLFLAES